VDLDRPRIGVNLGQKYNMFDLNDKKQKDNINLEVKYSKSNQDQSHTNANDTTNDRTNFSNKLQETNLKINKSTKINEDTN